MNKSLTIWAVILSQVDQFIFSKKIYPLRRSKINAGMISITGSETLILVMTPRNMRMVNPPAAKRSNGLKNKPIKIPKPPRTSSAPVRVLNFESP